MIVTFSQVGRFQCAVVFLRAPFARNDDFNLMHATLVVQFSFAITGGDFMPYIGKSNSGAETFDKLCFWVLARPARTSRGRGGQCCLGVPTG